MFSPISKASESKMLQCFLGKISFKQDIKGYYLRFSELPNYLSKMKLQPEKISKRDLQFEFLMKSGKFCRNYIQNELSSYILI
jgi:hypothetical protein